MASYIGIRRTLNNRKSIPVGGRRKLGAWSIHRIENHYDDRPMFGLHHYGTIMAEWCDNPDGTSEIGYTSIGWGSVSDQGGMNALFQTLNVGLRFDRAGGAAINPCETLPAALR